MAEKKPTSDPQPESSPKLDNRNSYSMYDSGPDPQDVARRIGLSVPDTTGAKK